jgi:hypothetical protein
MRLHKKMIRAGDYLHALVTAVVDSPIGASPEKWGGYEVPVVDASIISRPGSVYGDGASTCGCDRAIQVFAVRCSGTDEGETFRL